MKTLVTGFSLTGNTRFILKIISKELFADFEMLELRKPYPVLGNKLLNILACGFRSLFDRRPSIKEFEAWNDYDTVVVGSPVWAGRHAPPINSLIAKHDFDGKKVGVLLTGGAEFPAGLERFSDEVITRGGEVILSEYFWSKLKKEVLVSKAMKYAEELKKNL